MKKCGIILMLTFTLCFTGCAVAVNDGTELLEKKEYEAAIEEFSEAIKEDKNVAEAYRGQGIAYWELGKYKEAKQALEKALDNGAEETAVLYQIMGDSDMQTGDYESALSNYWKGMSCQGATEQQIQEMSYNEIAAYEYLSDWSTAKAKMKAYIEKYPDDEKAVKEAQFLETR